MNEQIIGHLQQLNLSLNEAKAYAAILEIGQTSAGAIIKKTQLHRSVIYETLDKLIARKLVFKLQKSNITYFQPTDPTRILQNIQSQEQVALDLVPQLKNLITKQFPEITVYEGIESWRRFWLDLNFRLPVGSTDYVAGSLGKGWQELMGKKATEKYLKTRIGRKLKWKMIVFSKDPIELELLKEFPLLHEYRLIGKGKAAEGNFNILHDESIVLHSATEPMIIEVKNPTLVRVFQNIFDILWETGKPM